MLRAGVDYAAGRPATVTASLRVWALSKVLRHPIVDPMDDYELFREFECYAAAEAEETRRQQARQQRAGRARGGR